MQCRNIQWFNITSTYTIVFQRSGLLILIMTADQIYAFLIVKKQFDASNGWSHHKNVALNQCIDLLTNRPTEFFFLQRNSVTRMSQRAKMIAQEYVWKVLVVRSDTISRPSKSSTTSFTLWICWELFIKSPQTETGFPRGCFR